MPQSINWKEKLPAVAVFIVLVLFLVFPLVFSLYPLTPLTYDQKTCILGGGQWSVDLTDCYTGVCGQSASADGICGGWSEPGCDCGTGKCWNPFKLKCTVSP